MNMKNPMDDKKFLALYDASVLEHNLAALNELPTTILEKSQIEKLKTEMRKFILRNEDG